MRRIKRRHFLCIYSVAVTCYCIWLLWVSKTVYETFNKLFNLIFG